MNTDNLDAEKVATKLMQSTKRLRELAPMVGSAKTIKAYDSDRKKHILSVEVLKAYKDGASSATEAEHRARASEGYVMCLERLQAELDTAEKIICEWDAENAAWDTARSLLSLQKATMRELGG